MKDKNTKNTKTKSKKKYKQKNFTYTKWLVLIILAFSIIDLQLMFIMPFFDKIVPETLGVALCTEIIAVILGYFLKSFRETNAEENIKMRKTKIDIIEDEIKNETENNEDGSVG